ncbi:MAG TPA: S49 family peptidase, partial [Candidatus Acidoferrales bacterium]|nr:S49 family peptidase [Candidatus Acidoferrales bacterium]
MKRMSVSREVRLAIVVSILGAVGAVECEAGNWTAGIAALGVAAAMVAAFWLAVVRPASIPRNAVVTVRLSGAIAEESRRSPIDQLLRRDAQGLDHLRYALEAVASDRDVRAVVVDIAGLECGLATAHELHRLLRAAQAGGRRVIALLRGDMVGPREYLVAAGAGEIVVNPDTMFTMIGVATGGMFLKRALDKLNVQAQTLQWKEYKGAAEQFGRETMSPALRESMEAMVGDWEKILVEAIASARSIPAE